VIRRRGGTPARSRLGGFESVRAQAKPLGEIAMRQDGLLVLSGGQYFRAVVDAASGSGTGDEAAQLRSSVHAALRRKLEPSELVLSALPGSLLPLPGVQALGLGLSVGSDVRVRGTIYCETAAGCERARELLERALADAARAPRLSGLAKLRVAQHQAELEVTGHLPREQLAPLLSALVAP
jgi:hypothetical protein